MVTAWDKCNKATTLQPDNNSLKISVSLVEYWRYSLINYQVYIYLLPEQVLYFEKGDWHGALFVFTSFFVLFLALSKAPLLLLRKIRRWPEIFEKHSKRVLKFSTSKPKRQMRLFIICALLKRTINCLIILLTLSRFSRLHRYFWLFPHQVT